MAGAALVETDLKAGASLVRKLDTYGFPLSGAFWYYVSEADEYRLMLVSTAVVEDGRLSTYRKLEGLLVKAKSSIPMERVTLLNPNDDIPKLLRIALQTGPGVEGIRFSRSTINGVFIPDAYIYRST